MSMATRDKHRLSKSSGLGYACNLLGRLGGGRSQAKVLFLKSLITLIQLGVAEVLGFGPRGVGKVEQEVTTRASLPESSCGRMRTGHVCLLGLI
jgi:hypothetical protein